jgi:hypothetical protein
LHLGDSKDEQVLTLLLVPFLESQPKQRMQFKELLSHPGIQLALAETRVMEA